MGRSHNTTRKTPSKEGKSSSKKSKSGPKEFYCDKKMLVVEFPIRTSTVHLVVYHKSKSSIIFKFIGFGVEGWETKQIAFDNVSQV